MADFEKLSFTPIVPEQASLFYSETRRKLAELNNDVLRANLNQDNSLREDLSSSQRERVELEQIARVLLQYFWWDCRDEIMFKVLGEFDGKKKIDLEGDVSFLVNSLNSLIKSIMNAWLSEVAINNSQISNILNRYQFLLKKKDIGSMSPFPLQELTAGTRTFFRVFWVIASYIPKVYFHQYHKSINPEDLREIIKNTLPLFFILTKNNMIVHSVFFIKFIQGSENKDNNWEIIEINNKKALNLREEFWEKFKKFLEDYKFKKIESPTFSSDLIATNCPALHAQSGDGTNIISWMYGLCMQIIENKFIPYLDSFNRDKSYLDVVLYLKQHKDKALFYGPNLFTQMRECQLLIPNQTEVRVRHNGWQVTRYYVNENFMLQSNGGSLSEERIGDNSWGRQGVYDPQEILKNKNWSVVGFNI